MAPYVKATYTANPFPIMKTGFSLCSFSHREIPVMKTGFSLCGKTTQGKPCTGPVRDCSAELHSMSMYTISSFLTPMDLKGLLISFNFIRHLHLSLTCDCPLGGLNIIPKTDVR